MNVNVDEFKEVIRKATMNYSIPSVQLLIDGDKVLSGMISEARDIITILEVENNVIDISDEVEFNFSEPSLNLVPFLNLIDEENADITIQREKIVLKSGHQRSNVHFCSPTIVSTFGSRSAREGTEYFITVETDDYFLEAYSKIKKVGARFGKVYFDVSNKKLSIETADKTNRFSNGLKFDLVETDMNDLTICFDYKNFVNLMSIIGNRSFKMSFAYIEEQNMGMLYAGLEDESEKYYLMSREV
jgi:hypothetical protein